MARLLHVFAGPADRQDGLAAHARELGWEVDEVDLLSGDPEHDLTVLDNQDRLADRLVRRRYKSLMIGTPCNSFTVARANRSGGATARELRSWAHPMGRPDATDEERQHLDRHNAFVHFTVRLARIALELDIDLVVENPAQRHRRELPSFWADRAHMPQLWDTPPFRALLAHDGPRLRLLTCPQCAFGPGPHGKLFQKWTSLACSTRPAERLRDVECLACNHDAHDDVACGRDALGASNSAQASAYPGPLNAALAWGLTGRRAAPRSPRHAGVGSGAGGRCEDCPPMDVDSSEDEDDGGNKDGGEGSTGRAGGVRDQSAPAFDRSVASGRIADGAGLGDHVRAEVERSRHGPKKWASFRNLEPASTEELRRLPKPDLLPHTQSTTSPGPPSQPGAPQRLAQFRALLGRNIRYADLWLPDSFERLQKWMARAKRGVFQPPAIFTQDALAPLARGYIWSCFDPDNCVPMEPSDRNTVFPGERQIDRAAFRRVAAEVGSDDRDIIGQVGEGGVESRSECALNTELHCHAPGFWERPEASTKEVEKELREEWALGPFYHTPTVPFRALPRDTIVQLRSRVLPDGSVEDYDKDRITLNPSKGKNSVNGGISKEQRRVALTNVRDLGAGVAVCGVAATDAGLLVALYATDIASAYSFLQSQRLDWWQFGFIWFDADGRLCFCILIRVGFGGAMAPRRFQSVSVIVTALARKRQAEFDALHPFLPEVAAWVQARRELQRRGELPSDAEQCRPDTAGVYIDDGAGCCCNDHVTLPARLYGVDTASIDLGAISTVANGGEPLERNSRPAAHCIILIGAIRAVSLEEASAKTESGSALVNLGLRIDVRRGLIDCPGPKRRIMLRDLQRWRESVSSLVPFERKMAEKQTGRLSNLTQVLPELLMHLSAGFQAANASYRSGGARRMLKRVALARGSVMQRGLAALLPHAIAVVEANEGVPLAPRPSFAAMGDAGVLTATTDASGHDGFGGYVFGLGAPDRPVVVSVAWPAFAKAALEQGKRRAVERTPGAPTLSMPAAELFASWAVAEAAMRVAGGAGATKAVIAVGDCDPAADALNAASSGTPQMSHLLAAARCEVRQWLGVSIPREWNLDADRLSHPHRLPEVLADACAAGLRPVAVGDEAGIPERCWEALREATTRGPDAGA